MRKFSRKRDTIIIAVVVAAACISAAAFYLVRGLRGAGGYVEVVCGRETVARLPLSQDGTFTPEQAPGVVIEIRDGAAAFAASDCPDKLCIHMGPQSREGDSAACLPNKTLIRITQ